MSGVAVLMLLGGFLGGKLIVLEHVAVLQAAFLSLQTVHSASPPFEGLRGLRFGAGCTVLADYDYSAPLSPELKGAYYSLNSLESYNFALALVLLPLLTALALRVLSATLCKAKEVLARAWPHVLGEMAFYSLVFAAYLVFSQLCFGFLLIASGVPAVYASLALALCQAALLFAYAHFLNKKPEFFGDFKRKFEKFNVCSYFYSFIVVERLLTAALIILLRNIAFGLALAILPLAAQLLFVAVAAHDNEAAGFDDAIEHQT